jgi:hypothetical protein
MNKVSVLILGSVSGPQKGQVLYQLTREQLTACQFSTAIVGGFAGATIGIRPGVIRKGNAPFYAHVEIRDDGVLCWEGRLSKPRAVGAWVTQLACLGYYFTALADRTFDSTAAGPVTAGDLAAAVVQESCPALELGQGAQWVDGQGSYTPSDYAGEHPSVVFAALAKAGHPSGYPMDYRVWEGRTLWSVARIPPAVPDYVIGASDPGLTEESDPEGSYGGLSVEYNAESSGTWSITAGNTSTTVAHGLGTTPIINEVKVTVSGYGGAAHLVVQNLTSTTFDIVLDVAATSTAAGGWDVTRRSVVTGRGNDNTFEDRMGLYRNIRLPHVGTLTNPAALALQDAELARRGYPKVTRQINRAGGDGLRTPTLAVRRPCLTRAGEFAWVAYDRTPAGERIYSPITQTTYDCLGGRLAVSPGEPLASLHETLRVLRDSDNMRRAGINPLSGVRVA